jgi:hypothetical protein
MTESIRSVLWKKEDYIFDGKKVYKYIIGTVLLTDKPIEGIIDGSEHIVRGRIKDMENPFTDVFSRFKHKKYSHQGNFDNLSDELLSFSNREYGELKLKELNSDG